MRRLLSALLAVSLVIVSLTVTTSIALAAPPDVVDGSEGTAFLCPAVGDGVLNAPFDTGTLYSGDQTFLPGHNQAGANVNENGQNTLGPGESPGPGNANTDWSPIWPPAD